jgi:hypothetical protein
MATSTVKPVYAGRAPVVARLAAVEWRDVHGGAGALGGGERGQRGAHGAVRGDRRAFAEDLVRTGRIGAARADSVATFAVREAYAKKVPPALVFGVMLVENSDVQVERAVERRRGGADAGLRQGVGAHARPVFGRNLRDDATNLRYGVHILAHYVYRAADDPTRRRRAAHRAAALQRAACAARTRAAATATRTRCGRTSSASPSRSAGAPATPGAWRRRCAASC